MPFPPVPPEVKAIAHYLKVAEEHDARNLVVSYWSRMYACQVAMKIVPGKKSPEVSALLVAIMDWLEKTKNENREVDGITDEVAAQAIIEEYAVQLFNYADAQDRAEVFNKNTIKAFYTTGILLDILQQFGELSEDLHDKRKYAKWKAAYIHHCLKIGDDPLPGPPMEGDSEDKINPRSMIPGYQIQQDDDVASNDDGSVAPEPPVINKPDPFMVPPVPKVSTPVIAPTPAPSAVPVSPQGEGGSLGASGSGTSLSAEQVEKAQKYCKWATSALNYDDVKTAIDNLQKALELLKFGKEN